MNEKRKQIPIEKKPEKDPFYNVAKQFEGFHFGNPNPSMIPNFDFTLEQNFNQFSNPMVQQPSITPILGEDSQIYKKKYEEEIQRSEQLIQKRDQLKVFVKLFSEIEEEERNKINKE